MQRFAVFVRDTLRDADELALAVVFQRCADRRASIGARCEALQRALHGRTWDDLEPIMATLDANIHAILAPNPNALVERLAHPGRRKALLHAIDRLSILPLNIAIPARFALYQWGAAITNAYEARDAAEAFAHVLRGHGDVFLSIIDALTDDLRDAVLSPQGNATLENALRSMARDDPLAAHRLTCALHDHSWHAASALC